MAMKKNNAPWLTPYFSTNSTVILYRGRLEENSLNDIELADYSVCSHQSLTSVYSSDG